MVVGKNSAEVARNPFNANITLTGHSLGGGLAGYVGMLYGKAAYVYDTMAFDAGASIASANAGIIGDPFGYRQQIYGQYAPRAPTASGIIAIEATGQALGFISGAPVPATQFDLNTTAIDPFDRHSMALLASLIYADERVTATDWKGAADYLWRSYFNTDIAARLPNAAAITGRTGSVLGTMQSELAYSGIETGTRPFGDTGIAAMFNDANDLGVAMRTSAAPLAFRSAAQIVSDITVEFAAMLADTRVLGSTRPGAVNGVLSYKSVGVGDPDITPSSALVIDLRETTWTFPGDGPHEIALKPTLIDGFLAADPGAEIDFADIAGWYGAKVTPASGITGNLLADIDRIAVTLEDASRPVGVGGTGLLLTLLNDTGMTYTGNSGINFVIGGTGDDTLKGYGNSDILIGGAGDDIINGGAGNDYLSGGSDNDTITGGAGNDTIYGGSDDDDLNGGIGDDVIFGGDGKDDIVGGAGIDVLHGGTGNDVINGGSEDDILFGDADDDILRSGSGLFNELHGGDGVDQLIFSGGGGIAVGGLGNDIIDVRHHEGPVYAYWAPGDGLDTVKTTLGFDPKTLDPDNYATVTHGLNVKTLDTITFDHSLSEMKIMYTITSTKSFTLENDVPFYIYTGKLVVLAKDGPGGIDLGIVIGTSFYQDAGSESTIYLDFENVPTLMFSDGIASNGEGWNIDVEIGSSSSARSSKYSAMPDEMSFSDVSPTAFASPGHSGAESAETTVSVWHFESPTQVPSFDPAVMYQIA